MSNAIRRPSPKSVSYSALKKVPHIVSPRDLNGRNDMFGGALFPYIDDVAASVVRLHTHNMRIATALAHVKFLHPLGNNDLIHLYASINRVWNTSCEVGVKVLLVQFQGRHRRYVPATKAYLTFASLDKDAQGNRLPMPLVTPRTAAEQRRFGEADVRRAIWLAMDKDNTEEQLAAFAKLLETLKFSA